jgi:outer membrane protein OmpA-like peptidoglycan-associated protein
MERKIRTWILAPLLCAVLATTSCAPISEETRPTNDNAIGTLGGAAVGAGVTAALHAPAPIIGLAGVAGASLGYYMTTMTFSAGGIAKVGGKVYTVGEFLTIEIPSDNLFDPNTHEFLDNSGPALDSIVSVLKRYPGHNIIISGNTSGYGTSRAEQRLSMALAEEIASYLWLHGITDNLPNPLSAKIRRLIYVGYGDNFPIANNIRISGIRANSRIQIVAYPCEEVLHWDKIQARKYRTFKNIGSADDNSPTQRNYASAFKGDPITGESAPKNPPPLANIPAPVQNFAKMDTDTLRKEFDTLPTPNKNPTPDVLIPLAPKVTAEEGKAEPRPIMQETPTDTRPMMQESQTEPRLSAQEAQAAIDQMTSPRAPQTVIGSNVKKHWGSKEDVTLKDETPFPAPLPSPDPDALPTGR